MKSSTPAIPSEQFGSLWSQLTQTGHNAFCTNGFHKPTWRQLAALDPVDSFVLNDVQQLKYLRSFLEQHSKILCAGYFSYDLGCRLHQIPSRHLSKQPLAIFHAYDNWLEIGKDHIQFMGSAPQSVGRDNHQILQIGETAEYDHTLNLALTVSRDDYQAGIRTIQDYIRTGDFYQINYTQQLQGQTVETASRLFEGLIQRHPAAHAVYFEHDDLAIHSLSPELFLHFSKGTLITEPIKGTGPRGKTPAEDKSLRSKLLVSSKEQAELYMITDLLRNDLGKVCEIGSIKVLVKKELQKLPHVWHTCSRIAGTMRSDLQPLDAFLSMFPGGSITGCPKRRAMEVIDELESSARGIYTGSLGYFHPDGDFSFNIAIRTLVQQGSQLSLGSGGGITIDSEWESEWEELLLKTTTFK